MNRQEEIDKVYKCGKHLVILGAGATLAATLRNPEKNGKQLPLMKNIVDVVGLNDIVNTLPQSIKILKNDFEKMYSALYELTDFREELDIIETKVYDYFNDLELPQKPNIYDYLILSLRYKKDTIATFNWDPFLYQAYNRNAKFVKSPGIIFLHGTVALGYDKNDGSSGPAGWHSKKTLGYFEPVRLLYPVTNKDYNSDKFIKSQWDAVTRCLKKSQRVTIFGYSAPKSDVEAISLFQKAWGSVDDRNMEEFELIDVREKLEVKDSWKTFIHTHHYTFHNSFFSCSIAEHPRRSVESYIHWAMPTTEDEAFQEGNPVPENFESLEQMWEWYNPLIEAEKKMGLLD
ncbi:MAG: hypothetical protein U9N18_01870 [Campylobacterota bacterium]|nr:hypothetical protein [Campylobacterota bacterium]